MTQRTAKLYYYSEKYEAFKRGITSELRLYNRDNTKAHSCVAFDPVDKKTIKAHGFKWDRGNHSYYLNNPTDAAIEEVKLRFRLDVIDHRNE